MKRFAVMALVASLVVIEAKAPPAAATTTVSFSYTGAAQQWTVPPGVTQATFDMYGAEGGYADGFAPGGKGGQATATIAVTPGQVLQINVGGEGEPGFTMPDNPGQNCNSLAGGGGGGATDVRVPPYDVASRKVIAGGGGGGGGYGLAINPAFGYGPASGGAGGGLAGADGAAGGPPGEAGQGGKGGTSAGGAGGDSWGDDSSGFPGAEGTGGLGADVGYVASCGSVFGPDGGFNGGGDGGGLSAIDCANCPGNGSGGGGGGGWFGGGGGGNGGFAGGGGGGSSLAIGGQSFANVRSGNGFAYITFKTPTINTMTTSSNPVVYGEAFGFGDVVCPTGPSLPITGSVEIRDGSTLVVSPGLVPGGGPGCSTIGAGFGFPPLGVGTHVLSATYGGDGNNAGSVGIVNQVVNKADTEFTFNAGTPNPSNFGDAVTFSVDLFPKAPSNQAPSPPDGPVTLSVDGNPVAVGQAVGGGGHGFVSFVVTNMAVGTHTVTASYAGNANYLANPGKSVSQTVKCANNVTGNQPGSLSISGGSWCITNATIGGGISISSGAAVSIVGSTVTSSITSTGGGSFRMCGSTVKATTTISNATGFVLIGDPINHNCAGNTLMSVMLSGNKKSIEVSHNPKIGGHVIISNTSGIGPLPEDDRPSIEANVITGSLSCSGSAVPATNHGQPNTVGGSRSGECAAPGF